MRHNLFESGINATDGRRVDLQTSFTQLRVGVTFFDSLSNVVSC
jgi:hypothetical protein